MLIKAGVDISRLNRDIRKALTVVANIYFLKGSELVVTSTYDGNHMPGSLHYSNDAFDIRLIPDVNQSDIVNRIKTSLGINYDVILESDHIHIEYDPDTVNVSGHK